MISNVVRSFGTSVAVENCETCYLIGRVFFLPTGDWVDFAVDVVFVLGSSSFCDGPASLYLFVISVNIIRLSVIMLQGPKRVQINICKSFHVDIVPLHSSAIQSIFLMDFFRLIC